MVADPCYIPAAELRPFLLICAGAGIVLAIVTSVVIAKFVKAKGLASSQSGCWVAAVFGLLAPIATYVVVDGLFPENGDDCGITPDIIFLPIEAALTVTFSFVVAFVAISILRFRLNQSK